MPIFMTPGHRSSLRQAATVAALALALSACQAANDRFLMVTDPDIINPSDVNSASVSREASVTSPTTIAT